MTDSKPKVRAVVVSDGKRNVRVVSQSDDILEVLQRDKFHGLLIVNKTGSPIPPSDGQIATRLVVLLLVGFLAFSMISIGMANLDNCPVEPMIPKYLVGAGVSKGVYIFLHLIGIWLIVMWKQGRMGNGALLQKLSVIRAIENLLTIPSFIWFILGTVYVYRYSHAFNITRENIIQSNMDFYFSHF